MKPLLERQSTAGNYADREDLFLEYRHLAKQAVAEAEDDAAKGLIMVRRLSSS